MRRSYLLSLLLFLVFFIGCQESATKSPSDASTVALTTEIATHEPAGPATAPSIGSTQSLPTGGVSGTVYGYTNQRPDGNRLAGGSGSLPMVEPLNIPLAGEPQWLVGAPFDSGSLWAAVLADGRTQAFAVSDDGVREVELEPSTLNVMPPLLRVRSGLAELVVPPSSQRGPAVPAVLEDGRLAYTLNSGELVVADNRGVELTRLAANALPDGRLLVDEQDRLLFLSQPTDRYDHGVLGDEIEAGGISLASSRPQPFIELEIALPEPWVVEGIAPLWVDLTGDGRRDIIVTQSDRENGAQIVVYDESGSQIAAGPAIGQGFRWRHQIAVAPFGPAGELELVDVLTPHIGGVVEFFQLEGDELRLVAELRGYTSHVIGSSNLDMAVAGDFDGDGRTELLLPDQTLSQLGAIRRTEDGAQVAWTVPLNGQLRTNLAAVTQADDSLALGVGLEEGTLRIWQP